MCVGRIARLIGLLVLTVALVIRRPLHDAGTTGAQILGEGRLSVGWAGPRRPAELLPFERLATRAERKALERQSRIPVGLRVLEGHVVVR